MKLLHLFVPLFFSFCVVLFAIVGVFLTLLLDFAHVGYFCSCVFHAFFCCCGLFLQLGKRTDAIDTKIKQYDAELLSFKQQMAKMRPGPARSAIQQRAMRVLQQKKVYEKQRDTVQQQSFNVDQTKFATESIRDTQAVVCCAFLFAACFVYHSSPCLCRLEQ